jgi:hypothetical protein
MHARHESPITGRFLSVDTGNARPNELRSWNRYIYAEDNPLRYVDPNGQNVVDVVSGFFNALGSDLLLGSGRNKPSNSDYAFGQAGGDFAAVAGSMVEMQDGAGLFEISSVATVGSAGTASEATLPVGITGGIAMLHGVGVFITANSMLGKDGTQITSTTVYNKDGARIDVENPNPGQRSGQIHLQLNDKKYLFDPDGKVFKDAPKSVQRLLRDPKVQAALKKALRYLGVS